MAKSASHQITTFASELEAMTKRNPLGILAGAVMAGVLIGFLARSNQARACTLHFAAAQVRGFRSSPTIMSVTLCSLEYGPRDFE
jgi:hypothetical protein